MSVSESIARLGLDVSYAEPALAQAAGGDLQLYTLLKGLIARESQWNPGAFRYEPAINDASYGLMQVLLGTARQALNNQGLTPSDLFIPEINIAAGTAYLRSQLNRYGDQRRAISAYNCGSECLTRSTSFWPNGNAAYVDDVLTYQNWYLNHMPDVVPAPSDTTVPTDTTPAETTTAMSLSALDINALVLGAIVIGGTIAIAGWRSR